MMRKWLHSNRSGKASIPLIIGIGVVVLTGGLAVPAFLGALGVTAQMATSAMFIAGSMLGSILFAQKAKTGNIPSMASYPVQRSNKGTPIPKVYGTVRVAGNVLWMGPNEPWVKKSSSGGKGGGGGSQITDQGNRRSFLIGICEGPATVLRMWKGKVEISLSNATFFTGDGNTGIPDLTGETYTNYPNLACAFFDSFEIGTSTALPNFTFEVLDKSFLSDYPQLQDILENDVTNILDNIFDDIEVSDPQGSTSIDNETELLAMTKDGSFFLTTDITITGNHTPLFTVGDPFVGTLDGRGFKITYVLDGGGQDKGQGFMAGIGDGALIQNLLMDGTMIAAGNGTGILAGSIGAFTTGADIKNVHVTGSIDIVNTWPTGNPQGNQRPDAIGGMVGTAAGNDADNRVNFSDCSATVDITIISVQNNGFINGLSGFGGGDNMDWCSFVDCHYRGTIDLTAGVINRSQDIGGFVGDISNSIFTKCSSNITLLGNDDVFAGFVGKDVEANVFDRCFSIGSLSSIGTNIGGHAGGFTPRPNEDSPFNDESTYTDCYSKCSIAWTRGFSDIGGFSGDIENSNSTIDNCYAIGALTPSDDTGGFSSGFEGGTITDCFWDTESTGAATSDGGTGKNTAQMKTESTYTNWDFENIWQIFSLESQDSNPSLIIKDLLTDTRYGAGIDASEFIDTDSFDAVEAYCDANGLLFSFVIDAQKPVLDWIDFINSHFQGYLFMTEGKIHLGIFKNESSTFTITQDNLVTQEGEDPPPPVSIKKRAFSQTFNRIEIAWKNRAKDYDTSITIAMDEVDQRVSGKVRKRTIQLIGITNADLAQKMAYVMLFDSMYRFTIYNFTVSYKDMLIRVGDVGTLSDGELIVSQKIRVTSIEEAKDGRGLVIEAVEDKNHIYETFSYTTEDSSRVPDGIPTLANASATFTESLTEGGFGISIAPGGADTNGWHIYKSFDDATYELVGQANIAGVTDGDANSTGTIRSPLPAHATGPVYAGAEVVEVNIGTITDLDTAITDDMFFNNQRLCKIGDEILAYKTCVETETTGVWRITGLIRGLFGTEAVAHTVGDVFWTINVDFSFAFADSDIGKTIYFKFLTFFGDSIQSLADVSGISYVIQGKHKRPMPVSLMRIQDREGLLTYETDDVVIAFYLASKTAGFNLGGFGDVLWDAYEPDLSIKTMDVTLKQTDDTEITNEVFDIFDIGEPMALLILDADRDGNNPYTVEMNPGALYAGIGSREITVEQI